MPNITTKNTEDFFPCIGKVASDLSGKFPDLSIWEGEEVDFEEGSVNSPADGFSNVACDDIGFTEATGDGSTDGFINGACDDGLVNVASEDVGFTEGTKDGSTDCSSDGACDIALDGFTDGVCNSVGVAEGPRDGSIDGFSDGACDIAVDGAADGIGQRLLLWSAISTPTFRSSTFCIERNVPKGIKPVAMAMSSWTTWPTILASCRDFDENTASLKVAPVVNTHPLLPGAGQLKFPIEFT